jgi:hypothetical protein
MPPPRPTRYEDARGRFHAIRFRKMGETEGRHRGGPITINASRSLWWQASTLHHELNHRAAEDPYVDDIAGGLDELIVNWLSTNVTRMWSRNAPVFAWIHYHLTGEDAPEQEADP